ncbi:hypothetical protein ACFOW1_15200 [Parasediminibacterium paludis]|uniref:Uncharacterized protein n=1 Tax=Parasediminibacterium paludis TaxID=908966 RepID=A0ABV8PZ40_9BACT
MQLVIYNLSKSARYILLLFSFVCCASIATYANKEGDGVTKTRNDVKKGAVNDATDIKKIEHSPVSHPYEDLSYESIREEFAPNDASQQLRDSAKNILDEINKSSTWVSTIAENASVQLPFGVKKKIGGSEYQVGISNIEFTGNGTFARAFARIVLPERDENGNKKELYFAGIVELTRVGGIVSDGKLALIGNEAVKSSGDWSLSLNGNDAQAPGKIDNQTYFKFDCSGFVEVGIRGDVLLSKDVYIPIDNNYLPLTDPKQRASAPVNVVVNSFSDLIINKLQFSHPFMLKKVIGYALLIKDATLDMSDTKNPSSLPTGFSTYLTSVQPDEPNTWVGLIVNDLQVYLPKEFRRVSSNNRLTISAPFGVLDATGFSTTIDAKNIMSLAEGAADKWPFSVDQFGLKIKGSELGGGSLAGNIILPIQTKTGSDHLTYKGTISDAGDYSIQVSFTNGLKADFWKSTLTLDPSSSITLAVVDGVFRPKAVLTGKLSFDTDGGKDEKVADGKSDKKKTFSCDGITFEQLTLQTVKPYFSVKAMGAEGALRIASFEADYNIQVAKGTSSNGSAETASMKLGLDIKLMNEKIEGKTDFTINAVYNEQQNEWQYQSFQLGQIGVSADFGKTKFSGVVTILKNDPIFGNGLAGDFTLDADKFELKAKGIFGVKDDFRYWSVDGSIDGLQIKAGEITFTGFSGGASYKMNTSNKDSKLFPSGILYVPDNNAFLRVRAGIMFDVVKKDIMTADAGFEIVFNTNWGVNQVLISGNFKMYTGGDSKDDASSMKSSMKAFSSSSSSTPQQNGAVVWGKVLINLDFKNDTYSGSMDVYVNEKNKLYGDQGSYKAGTASFFIGNNNWDIKVGSPESPIALRYKEGPFDLGGTGYFMIGNDLKTSLGNAGFAIRCGMGVQYNLDYSKAFLYAHVDGGVKIDIQLAHFDNPICNGEKAGFNGWVGDGNLKAWLNGSAGVQFEFDIAGTHYKKQWEVFNASINADLYVKGPKPLYFKGEFNGKYKVRFLIFEKTGDFTINFEKGTNCEFIDDATVKKVQGEIQSEADSLLNLTKAAADSAKKAQAAQLLAAQKAEQQTAQSAIDQAKQLAAQKAAADAAAAQKIQDDAKRLIDQAKAAAAAKAAADAAAAQAAQQAAAQAVQRALDAAKAKAAADAAAAQKAQQDIQNKASQLICKALRRC